MLNGGVIDYDLVPYQFDRDTIFVVDTRRAIEKFNLKFYKTEGGVVLTSGPIDPSCLHSAVDSRSGDVI